MKMSSLLLLNLLDIKVISNENLDMFLYCILYGNHLVFILEFNKTKNAHDQIFKCSSLPGSGMALETSQVNPKVKAYLTPDITGLT